MAPLRRGSHLWTVSMDRDGSNVSAVRENHHALDAIPHEDMTVWVDQDRHGVFYKRLSVTVVARAEPTAIAKANMVRLCAICLGEFPDVTEEEKSGFVVPPADGPSVFTSATTAYQATAVSSGGVGCWTGARFVPIPVLLQGTVRIEPPPSNERQESAKEDQ